MRKYALIHATTDSVAPLKRELLAQDPGCTVTNYVNEELLQYVRRTGDVDKAALRMFARTIFTALEDRPSAVMIACNVYAPYADCMQPFSDVPLLTVDHAMQEKAAHLGVKLGIIGTNSKSAPACFQSIAKMAEAAGRQIPACETATVLEAANALEQGDMELFDTLLTEHALKLQKNGCEAIILGQITMARSKIHLEKAGITVPILTSPEEGVRAMIRITKDSSDSSCD
jgi:Asp/Glu/hydantoin racemase